MKTEQLIELLAREAGPVPAHSVERRIWPIAVAGLLVSALVGALALGWVPMAILLHWGWWAKFGYAVSLAAVGGWLCAQLARPAHRIRAPRLALCVVLCLMGLYAAASWLTAAPASRVAELLGHSWNTCPRNIVLLALPPMAGALWALRGLAPTRPRLAGAATGLFAGALGASAYALSCSELAPTFVAVWYTAGIAVSTALGALIGPRALRW